MKRPQLVLIGHQIDGINLVDVAWELLLSHAEGIEVSERKEYIRHLVPHWRAIYTISKLEGEVNNGGFHQFFWNSEGSLNKETLADLRLISASPFVLLFEEALDVYEQRDYAGDKKESGNSWAAFTEGYKEKRMGILDTAFCQEKKSPSSFLADYIRSNRCLYIQN